MVTFSMVSVGGNHGATTGEVQSQSPHFQGDGLSALAILAACPELEGSETPEYSAIMWKGRFQEETSDKVQAYGESISFDWRLYAHDIRGSIAHARMLAHVGIISDEECDRLIGGLEGILADIEQGDFSWSVALEDIHMNIEARLIERIGDTGKKLHTGRSRNDQVATDIRLYLRGAIDHIAAELTRLQRGTIELAATQTHVWILQTAYGQLAYIQLL